MATGLIALLDDIATIADDVATLTVAATKKTAGIVTDDMAVTAEQTLGLARERELPVVARVAWGSLFNKCLILAPAALLLNVVAPWSITPILMAGGLYLAYEGVHKLLHRVLPHDEGEDHASATVQAPPDPVAYEKERVRGAIRTDLILSAEIIAIALGEVKAETFAIQAAVLYTVSIALTVGVYGLVAGLVKLDDLGEALVRTRGLGSPLGRGLLFGTPYLLHAISWIGTVAMLLVGGHILLHGLPPLEHLVHDLLHHLEGFAAWLAGTAVDLVVGAAAGLVVVGLVSAGQRVRDAVR